MSFKLRDYQSNGVDKIRDAFRRRKKFVLFILPTGGGKTAVFSYIAESAVGRGKKVLILVHRQELLNQASAGLARLGVEHGLISPRFEHSNSNVQIASVQTAVRRLDKLGSPDLIIIDEAHHATASTYRKILEANPSALVLGVTATPVRSDGKGLGIESGGIFDDIVIGPSVSDLIGLGFLVEPEVYAPPLDLDLSGLKRKMGDYDKKQLDERFNKPRIFGCAVDHYLRLCPGQPAIAFCNSVARAEEAASEFRARGVRAVRVDGAMEQSARVAAIEGLGNGSVDVLTSADLIGEGVDIPRVSAAILLRPTQSLGLYLQQVGRALRPYPGKKRAIILDHVGNTLMHGFADDDRAWSLTEGYREKKIILAVGEVEVKIFQCVKCYHIYESTTVSDLCPNCKATLPIKVRKIRQVSGSLKKVTEEEREAILRAKQERSMERGSARSEEDLIRLATARGYKNPAKWAAHVIGGRKKKR